MKQTIYRAIGLAAAGWLALGYATAVDAQDSNRVSSASPEKRVTARATGTFEVKLTPLANDEHPEGAALGRMAIDKQFLGDLTGTSKGEMLTSGSSVKTSAGYVAIERVVGTLHGRRGTFVLQHNGIMTRGDGKLTITVVPDSGTGDLTGLAGTMTIEIAGGKHSYVLEYSLGS
jgi:hypothetical protein